MYDGTTLTRATDKTEKKVNKRMELRREIVGPSFVLFFASVHANAFGSLGADSGSETRDILVLFG